MEQTGETESFQRADPVTPYYSYILIGCIIAVLVVQLTTNLETSIRIAGLYKPVWWDSNEYWRVITAGALHTGIVHLVFNSYALFLLGRLIETISNRAHMANVFLLSVIGGSLFSSIFGPEGLSVGASGGILGLLGYLAVYGFYRRKLLSNAFLKNMLFNIAFIGVLGAIVLPLIGSFGGSFGIEQVPRIDNFAHLGGLVAGVIYGLFQIPRDLYKDPREVSGFTDTIGLTALGIFMFFSVLSILLIFNLVEL